MKFKDHADYMAQRNALLNEAETLLQDGNTEEYDAKVEEINSLDSAYEEFAQKQADLAAMRGAVKAPISNAEANRVVASIMDQDDDLDYRKSFMNYVLHGTPMSNADAITTTGDVGAVIPNTIINKIYEKLESVGGIYAQLTKTFYKGGVSVPTSAAKPVATWTTERGGSDKQNKTVGSVTFAYHKLRCVVAVSIAVDNVTLEIFENTLAQNVVDAMTKAIEDAAFNGRGASQNEPEGILAFPDKFIPEQVVDIAEGSEVTYSDLLAAEGALPAGYDAGAEWYMKKTTFYNQFLGMVDDNKQPIARINAGVDGKPEAQLLGRKVNFTDYVPAFAKSASADTPFAAIFNFAYYILNTNLQITIKEYEDHDTDDQVKKAIMLVDGKPVDFNSLVIMQVKKA